MHVAQHLKNSGKRVWKNFQCQPYSLNMFATETNRGWDWKRNFPSFFFSIQYFLCVWSELVLHVSEILLWCHKVCTQTCILKHLRSSISTLVVPILRLCLCDAGSNTLFKAVDRNQKIAFLWVISNIYKYHWTLE